MLLILATIAIIGVLAALDLAALKWGINMRMNGYIQGTYDPRHDWN